MPGVCLVPVPPQPCFVSKIKHGTNWGIECNRLKCLAASSGSQNVFLEDSLVSNFMKFSNQEWKKLGSSFSSGPTNMALVKTISRMCCSAVLMLISV